VAIQQGARVSTSLVDDGCVIGRGTVVGAMSSNRVARDEEIVHSGRDSRVGSDVGVLAGARLEPGTTA